MNRFQDRRFSLRKFFGLIESVLDPAQSNFIQSVRRLFAIAGDEWNGVPVSEQIYRCLDLRRTDFQSRGDFTGRLFQVEAIELFLFHDVYLAGELSSTIFHLPQSRGVSSASLGTSAVIAVALLAQ